MDQVHVWHENLTHDVPDLLRMMTKQVVSRVEEDERIVMCKAEH
jgi:hypothetical protein